jgi:hypothetical protein
MARWNALQIHSHTHPSLHIISPAPEEKTPRPWTKASNPSGRIAPQRSAPFESEFSFNLLPAFACDLVLYPLFVFFSLDLLPKEIFGTEETPEYISSDSSLEAEDATPEQRINTSYAAAFGIWSMTSGTSPLAARPNANVAWLWRRW